MNRIPDDAGSQDCGREQSDDRMDQRLRLLSVESMRNRIGVLLILLGISLLVLPIILYMQGMYSQWELEREWQAGLQEAAETPEGVAGFPPTKILIPKIHLDAVVIDGITPESLSKGPGHFPDTALPGEHGNCCIAAHRNMYGSWFGRLNQLAPGDKIILRCPAVDYVYHVAKKFRVLPTNEKVLEQTDYPTLTLVTCTPVPKPTHRLIVTARLIERRKTGT